MSQDVQKQEEVKEQPNALLISAELANALVQYLSTKSFGEVEGLVNGIRQGRPVTVKQETPVAYEPDQNPEESKYPEESK